MGVDVMRWMYAAQNPPLPELPGHANRRKDVVHADQEVHRKLLTLWNCYSFYVTYAAVDGVTPDKLRCR